MDRGTRRRVYDGALGRRVTRDWRIGHFLIWRDGQAAPTLDRQIYREVLPEARAYGVDQSVVHGRLCTIGGTRMSFEQFGVRSRTQREGLAE